MILDSEKRSPSLFYNNKITGNLPNRFHCTGCGACYNICTTNAISMLEDAEGFMQPVIDGNICTNCGVCIKTCPLNNESVISDRKQYPEVYALNHKDTTVRLSSSSGGAFTALSDYIIRIGGIIYGAAFDDKFQVIHKKAETVEQREALKGSKYVQSDLKDIFTDIRNELSKGRTILFTGTSCQTAGLNNLYISK